MKKRMVTRWKRPLAAVLGALFVLSAVCGAGSSLPESVKDTLPDAVRETVMPVTVQAAPGNRWLNDGASVLTQNAGGAGAQIVYYAGREWYVIAYGANTCTLLQKNIIETSAFDSTGTSNEYGRSTLKTAMENIVGNTSIFSAKERAAISKRTLTGNNVNYGQGGHNPDTIKGSQVDDAELWPLSVAETGSLDVSILRTGSYWWLRSPGFLDDIAAHVRSDGFVTAPRPQRERCPRRSSRFLSESELCTLHICRRRRQI